MYFTKVRTSVYEAIPLRVSHVKGLIFAISLPSKGHSSRLFKDIPAFELKKQKEQTWKLARILNTTSINVHIKMASHHIKYASYPLSLKK